MIILEGKSVCSGISFGRIRFLDEPELEIVRHPITDADAELKRFKSALKIVDAELGELYEKALNEAGTESAQIFEIHRMMLEDEDYLEAIEEGITVGMTNAEYVVFETGEKFAGIFSKMEDEYMKGRAADVRDISNRLISVLSGASKPNYDWEEPVILAASNLAPSETVQLDKSKIAAFATRFGSASSHTAILARTMNIPAVISLGENLMREYEGRSAIIDGYGGKLFIEPDEETISFYREKLKADEKEKMLRETLRGKESVTLDGRKVKLFANIGSPDDLNAVLQGDAEGIGLYRSEFLYLKGDDYPTEEQQFIAYKTVVEGMAGKQVVIRTLDIGADKKADYFDLPDEENPAMGMRAIRICLTRPELFKTQLRAIYRASAFGSVAIMFPMITSVKEVLRIKEIAFEARLELDSAGVKYDASVPLGIMVETPAAALISDSLAKEVDFFSIGTNDLTQYTLAIDRQNQSLDQFVDPYHPAILKLIEMTIENSHKNGIWTGICGELGADTAMTETFLRMGVDELSVSPPAVLKVRHKVRETDLRQTDKN